MSLGAGEDEGRWREVECLLAQVRMRGGGGRLSVSRSR